MIVNSREYVSIHAWNEYESTRIFFSTPTRPAATDPTIFWPRGKR
jgi:hypothetical protein